MRCGYFYNVLLFFPETQVAHSKYLMWEGKFTLWEEHPCRFSGGKKKKRERVETTTIFQRQESRGRIIKKSKPWQIFHSHVHFNTGEIELVWCRDSGLTLASFKIEFSFSQGSP